MVELWSFVELIFDCKRGRPDGPYGRALKEEEQSVPLVQSYQAQRYSSQYQYVGMHSFQGEISLSVQEPQAPRKRHAFGECGHKTLPCFSLLPSGRTLLRGIYPGGASRGVGHSPHFFIFSTSDVKCLMRCLVA